MVVVVGRVPVHVTSPLVIVIVVLIISDYRHDVTGSSHYPPKQVLFLDPFYRGIN